MSLILRNEEPLNEMDHVRHLQLQLKLRRFDERIAQISMREIRKQIKTIMSRLRVRKHRSQK